MKNSVKQTNRNELQAVIFDWAGTTVDFGCFGPTGVFVELFRLKGIEITINEARGPMGMHKRDHIRELTNLPRVHNEWKLKYGRECTEKDIDELYNHFIPMQLSALEEHSEVIPELFDSEKIIKSHGMKIGSTTGYNDKMMEILASSAARQGYIPDSIVCATDVPAGRPAPWMAFRCAENLGVYPMHLILKVGDTIADILEGKNAGMWSVGVVDSSNEMGLTRSELLALDGKEYEERRLKIIESYKNAGADYVIDNLSETEELIVSINERLGSGERPLN